MKRQFLLVVFLWGVAFSAFAQNPSNSLPIEIKAEDATITEFGHATMMVKY